jgi:hypothetical protein
MARRRATALAVAFGSVLGTVVLRRRRRQQTRVDLYFADGSMLALGEADPAAATLVRRARELL